MYSPKKEHDKKFEKPTQLRGKKYNRMQVTLNEVNGTSILLYFFPQGYIAFKAYNF